MAIAEEATKVIGSIHFTLISPSDIRKLSAVEIQTADTYDEDGVPIVSGLMDGRLGTLEPRQKCKTCGNTASACPGHFGHIELAEPVVHVAFAKLLHKLLQVTCRNCGRVLLSRKRSKRTTNECSESRGNWTRSLTHSTKPSLKMRRRARNVHTAAQDKTRSNTPNPLHSTKW